MSSKKQIQKSMYGILKDSGFRKNERGNLVVNGFFTSDNRDMAGDVITRDATERAIPLYKQWGNVRYLHTPKPVGKVRRIGIQDGLAWNEAEIEIIDPDAIFQVENELLTALSVGILVDFKDIDIDEETGGFIINNYTLAEISLVDHPANYDAKLKDIILDEDARHLALQYGLDGLANHIGGKEMPKKEKDAIVEEEVLEEEEGLELSDDSQEITEEEVTEELLETEEVEFEEVVDELSEDIDDSEPEPQEEIEELEIIEASAESGIEKDIPEEEETIEEENLQGEEIPVQEGDLEKAILEIKETLKVLVEAQKSGKGSEEEQETDEVDQLQKQLEAIKEQNEELTKRLEELENSIPAERKGLVEETNLQDLDDDVEDEEIEEKPTLRKALRAHFNLVE